MAKSTTHLHFHQALKPPRLHVFQHVTLVEHGVVELNLLEECSVIHCPGGDVIGGDNHVVNVYVTRINPQTHVFSLFLAAVV